MSLLISVCPTSVSVRGDTNQGNWVLFRFVGTRTKAIGFCFGSWGHEPRLLGSVSVREDTNQGNAPAKTEDAFVLKVCEAITAHLSNEDFTVEQLCKLVFLCHSQLHRKLEAVTGCSPNRFIRMMRLAKAKEMLQQFNTSISNIAMECGYSDAGYFSRLFKQEMEMTPNEWRGQLVT